jgi:hypothetical protein
MTHDNYKDLLIFKSVQSSALIPDNAKAIEFLDQIKNGKTVVFQNKTPRDLAFHKGYFKLLSSAYDWMPKLFKDQVKEGEFYEWLKQYNKQYDVKYQFKDGRQWIKTTSISFGRMNKQQFEDYVRDQIPTIYEVLMMALPDEVANAAIATLENDFERYLSRL